MIYLIKARKWKLREMFDLQRTRCRFNFSAARGVSTITQRVALARVTDLDAKIRRQLNARVLKRRAIQRDRFSRGCVRNAPLIHDAAGHACVNMLDALTQQRKRACIERGACQCKCCSRNSDFKRGARRETSADRNITRHRNPRRRHINTFAAQFAEHALRVAQPRVVNA
jgi:hypothetical protein